MNKKELLVCGPAVLATATLLVLYLQKAHQLHVVRDDADAMRARVMQTHRNITTTKNDYKNANNAVDHLRDNITHLEEIIDQMQSRDPEIRYITRTQTIIKAAEPTITFKTPPEHYIHFLDEMPVADFIADENGYTFKTYDLSLRSTLVVGKKDSSVLVQISSSADNTWHDIPSELTVIDTHKKYPALRPSLHLGVASNSSRLYPSGLVATPFFEYSESLDFGAPAVNISPSPSVALLIAGYNVGKPLPLVDDLWVWTGPSVDLLARPGVEVAITTKF